MEIDKTFLINIVGLALNDFSSLFFLFIFCHWFFLTTIDKTYSNIDQLYNALRDKVVDGILLDAYTVSSNMHLYDHDNFNPVKLIKYPRYYGVVLSGDLANIARELGDNARAKENEILAALDTFKDTVPVCFFIMFLYYKYSI